MPPRDGADAATPADAYRVTCHYAIILISSRHDFAITYRALLIRRRDAIFICHDAPPRDFSLTCNIVYR